MQPYLCPVCQGKGTVPPGFYGDANAGSSTAAFRETCRACGGSGYIMGAAPHAPPPWTSDQDPVQPPWKITCGTPIVLSGDTFQMDYRGHTIM